MGYSKRARNDEIKRLYASGVSQSEIGRQFNIVQARVSAIILGRLPKYRYCRSCKARLSDTTSLCELCRMKNWQARDYRRNKKIQEAKELRAQRDILLAQKREKKERSILLKKLIKLLKRKLVRMRVPKQQDELTIKAFALREYDWQRKGREHVRFLVRVRDDFTCQDCGLRRTPEDIKLHNKEIAKQRGIKSLDVHHINGQCGKNTKGYDKRSEMDGLITLCHKCHFNRHDFQPNLKRKAADRWTQV